MPSKNVTAPISAPKNRYFPDFDVYNVHKFLLQATAVIAEYPKSQSIQST